MSLFITIVLSLLTVYSILSYVLLAGVLIVRHTDGDLEFLDFVIWFFSPIILLLILGMALYEYDISKGDNVRTTYTNQG